MEQSEMTKGNGLWLLVMVGFLVFLEMPMWFALFMVFYWLGVTYYIWR
jgi:hypothetical protein